MKISGKIVDSKWFYWDGCHKIYLSKAKTEKELAVEQKDYAWDKETTFPISQIVKVFNESCPFRFINEVDTLKTIVPQCRKRVTFEFDNGDKYIVEASEIMSKIKKVA